MINVRLGACLYEPNGYNTEILLCTSHEYQIKFKMKKIKFFMALTAVYIVNGYLILDKEN